MTWAGNANTEQTPKQPATRKGPPSLGGPFLIN
jgi:hypothetical protein